MDQAKFNKIKKPLLYFQMALTVLLLIVSIYLFFFVTINKLGAWMIVSYIFITISVVAMICYAIFGYKKDELAYKLAIIPFMAAVFVNILLPNRAPIQIALLSILFAVIFGFLLKLNDEEYAYWLSLIMVAVALTFSVYSAVKADVRFLGDISEKWPTYVAMYLSIFIPSIMSGTIALTNKVRNSK